MEKGRLRVDVIDGAAAGDGRWRACRPSLGESGWGLYLVETLASRWGHGAGRYWFELEIGGSTGPG